MVRAGRAAGERKFSEADFRGKPHLARAEARPDRVKLAQPTEEKCILRGRNGTRQGLEQMVMRVHEAWRDDGAAHVVCCCLGVIERPAHLLNDPVFNQDIRLGQVLAVHGYDMIGTFQQERGHPVRSFSAA